LKNKMTFVTFCVNCFSC